MKIIDLLELDENAEVINKRNSKKLKNFPLLLFLKSRRKNLVVQDIGLF
ncbi:hypothetical protein ACTWKD_12385 [Halanaerobium saccharolyticum]